MLVKQFVVSWITATVVMLLAFYLWHGLFLNDFNRIHDHKQAFMIAAPVYMAIGLLVCMVYSIRWPDIIYKKPVFKGILAGGVCGAFIFFVSLVIGLSFSNSLTLKNLIFDLSWQIVEQSLGGGCIGFVHAYFFHSVFDNRDSV